MRVAENCFQLPHPRRVRAGAAIRTLKGTRLCGLRVIWLCGHDAIAASSARSAICGVWRVR
eukprot:scaffold322155_cov43-Prasinocladus_malaysianus.AAC.1